MSLDSRENISEKVKQYKVLLSKDFTAFTTFKVLSDITHFLYRNIEEAATTGGSSGGGGGDIIIDGGEANSTYTSEIDGGSA